MRDGDGGWGEDRDEGEGMGRGGVRGWKAGGEEERVREGCGEGWNKYTSPATVCNTRMHTHAHAHAHTHTCTHTHMHTHH